jgi:plasmid replication initiation protein
LRKLENINSNQTDLIAVANSYALSKKTSLTPLATRLFVWCVSQIKKTDRDLVTFKLSAEDFITSFGSTNVKRDLDRITDELMDFQIRMQNESGAWEKVNAMTDCSYKPDDRMTTLRFSTKMWECFTNLNNGNFASGSLQIFTQVNSRFAFNLYIFLHNNLNTGTCTIDILEFGEFIGAIEQTYSKWAQLNAKILKPLQQAFNEHSPVKFEYKATGKVGRKFTKVKFYNIKKGKVQGQLLDENNPCKKVDSVTESAEQQLAKSFWETLSLENKDAIKEALKEKGEPAPMLEYDASCIMSLANHPELIQMEPK